MINSIFSAAVNSTIADFKIQAGQRSNRFYPQSWSEVHTEWRRRKNEEKATLKQVFCAAVEGQTQTDSGGGLI